MRTIDYTLKGKDVPSLLAGTVVKIKVPETYKEAETLTKVGESDVVSKFADGYVIALQGLLRNRSGRKDKDGKLLETRESLQTLASGYVYSVQAEGGPKASKPETVAKRAAASSGNKLFEKCRSDEKFRAQMIRNGVLDEAEFATWLEASAAVKAESDAAKVTPAPAAATA